MGLRETILADLKAAMKAGEVERRDVLRMLDAAIKNTEIEKKKRETGLSEEEVLEVVMRSVKQRQDSIKQFEEGGRPELAEKEKQEVAFLLAYLPAQLPVEEVEKIVQEVIVQLEAKSMQDLGKVMGETMKRVKGQTDGNVVREIAQKLLA